MSDYINNIDSFGSQLTSVASVTEEQNTSMVNSSLEYEQIEVVDAADTPLTTVSDDQPCETTDVETPNYLRQRTIIVRRYQLRK